MNNSSTNDYLAADQYFDLQNPDVLRYVHKKLEHEKSKPIQIIKLYKAVRDDFKYDPYSTIFDMESFKASRVLNLGRGHCIDKASFLVACYRVAGIPARLGLAKVKNHIATEKLEKVLKSNVLTPHGYVEVFSENKWVKCTPAFNKELCEKLRVPALDFDGKNDSIFQSYNKEGGKFMEYLEDYGTYDKFPYEFIISNFKQHYPHLFEENGTMKKIEIL
ncbi:MAG: transglutaminase family protein [Flammeovirgaceae bacterium]